MSNPVLKKGNLITVLYESNRYGKAALQHAFLLSQIFQTKLCIIPLSDDSPDLNVFLTKNAEAFTHHLPLKPLTIHQYNEDHSSILMVLGVGKSSFFTPKKALKWIKDSRIPCLCTPDVAPAENAYKQVLLPLNVRKQDKEKALWAGYFSRFYMACVHILYVNYTDAFLHKNIFDNIAFTQKLYENLEINY